MGGETEDDNDMTARRVPPLSYDYIYATIKPTKDYLKSKSFAIFSGEGLKPFKTPVN